MTTKFVFSCPSCQVRIGASSARIGTECSCPKCGQRLEIPAPLPAASEHIRLDRPSRAAPQPLPTNAKPSWFWVGGVGDRLLENAISIGVMSTKLNENGQ